jgi:hypothetical protein
MSKGQNINVDVDSGNTTKVIVYGVVGVAVLALAYFGIIRPILQTLQIIDTKEERKGKKDEKRLSRKAVLTPSLYMKNMDFLTISSGRASQLASNVFNGKWGGCWGTCDDEAKGVGGIIGAGTLVNISYVADIFNKSYGKDMHTYLDSYLEKEDWGTIDDYIKKTKKY